MCAGPFKPKMPPPPDNAAAQSARNAKREALKAERNTASQLKNDQTEITMAALAGKAGRRSLLSGKKKGGGGFDLSQGYKTKQTLGA